jgi:prophage DNA circulation protein
MSTIRDIHNPWRDALLPASFDGCFFHVEAGSKENGRRIVVHEFPKKNTPYAEDMGKRAIEFSVRAYCIQYPFNATNPADPAPGDVRLLYMRDYRIARDLLRDRLEREGSGTLQLPSLPPMRVVCPRYRLSEEERLGGFCVFDMQFVEFGAPPAGPQMSSRDVLLQQAAALQLQALQNLALAGKAGTDVAGGSGPGVGPG